ncbi:MAG: DUF2975 domain-containing protein [Opitutus sp.]
MKLFPKLARSLRFYFGLARTLILIAGAFWFLALTVGPVVLKSVAPESKLMVSIGEVSLRAKADPITIEVAEARPGSIVLTGLRGPFQADLLSNDPALISALRWTIFPSVSVLVAFTWLLCNALRTVCANIEQRQIFTDTNLRLIRKIGLILIIYAVVSFLVQLFAARVMGSYFMQHVTIKGLEAAKDGLLQFNLTTGGSFPIEAGVVTGLLVLLLGQAFRQGLALKTENDLTV